MPAKINTFAVLGLEAEKVEVEVDILPGLPSFTIVGLGDTAVHESRERVRSAVKNSGYQFPRQRITVNLAPADRKKVGPSFDLPMAIGILAATGQIVADLENKAFVGELALDGHLRHTNGILPIVSVAEGQEVYLPQADTQEAALIPDRAIYGAGSLEDVVNHLQMIKSISPTATIQPSEINLQTNYPEDMCYVKGQEQIKRALEIAAAGGHNILMYGPPGSGKTLLARTFRTILPQMGIDEIIEVTKLYSISGLLPPEQPLIIERPFRSPHHTASGAALVGGGNIPRPGEISLAHRGVLFLDEFAEFNTQTLESLRQPLEDHRITISRAKGSLTFPANFILIAAMNPCPCGFLGDKTRECTCSPGQISRYQSKISGPLLDRIDIHVEVPAVEAEKLTAEEHSESSASIIERVEAARAIQAERLSDSQLITNSEMTNKDIEKYCTLEPDIKSFIEEAIGSLGLSARAYHRILRVARTITDLDGRDQIVRSDIAEAIQYRSKKLDHL